MMNTSVDGRRSGRRRGMTFALATALLLAGCASTEGTKASATRSARNGAAARQPTTPAETPNAGATTAAKYDDPVAMASLRERALALLAEQAAAGAPEVRANALEGLSVAARRAEPILRAALVDRSPALRITAAVVIGNIKLDSSASYVEPLLSDPVLAVRASAVYALKRCGRVPDMASLAELLADQSPRMRAHAAMLLGKLGDRSALGMLEEAVRDSFPRASASEVRIMELQVAEARVRLGDEEAIHSIRASLFPARSEDLETTALAAQLTGELADRASTRELVMLTRMRDDSGNLMPPEVRMAAAGSLASMRIAQTNPEGVAREYVSNGIPTVRAQAAFVLGQSGRREELETLERLLADASPAVQVTAAAAIARITDRGGSAGTLRE